MKHRLRASVAALSLLTVGATFTAVNPSARPCDQVAAAQHDRIATFQMAREGAGNDHDTACTPNCNS